MKEYNFNDTSWNMSEAFLIRLDNLFQKADELAIDGNLLGVYRVLKRVYVSILWKLEKHSDKWKTERKKIEELFSDAEKDFKTGNNVLSKNLHLVEETLFKINHRLNYILFEEGMLYIEKGRKTFQEEVKEAFT